MNTITITSASDGAGVQAAVTFTEFDVLQFKERSDKYTEAIREQNNNRTEVYDFFDGLEWSGGEATVNRDDVNELLRIIGTNPLISKYRATVTITAYVTNYPAENENDAASCIEDDISVDIISGANIDIAGIELDDIEEDE